MATESKKHHFVPKSLLKNFYNADGRFFVFDKLTGKSFPSTVENAGHENYFNSLEVGGSRINFESFFEEIDSEQAKLIQKLLSFEANWELELDEIGDLVYFTLVQMARTKLARTSIVELSKEIQEWSNKLSNGTPYKPVTSVVGGEESKVLTMQRILDIPDTMHLLLERGISLLKAPEGAVFYVSDNPVVMYNPFPYGQVALAGIGTEVCFPISKKIMVSYTCRSTCDKILAAYTLAKDSKEELPPSIIDFYQAIYENKIITLEPRYVDFFNHLQVGMSSRFLYSATDGFQVANQMIGHSPELKERKATIGLGSRPFPNMPDGEQIVFYLKNKDHTMISISNLNGEFDLHFKVEEQDCLKFYILYKSKTEIEYVEVFRDKMRSRFMREVEILSFENGSAVVGHKDRSFNEILEFVKKNKKGISSKQ